LLLRQEVWTMLKSQERAKLKKLRSVTIIMRRERSYMRPTEFLKRSKEGRRREICLKRRIVRCHKWISLGVVLIWLAFKACLSLSNWRKLILPRLIWASRQMLSKRFLFRIWITRIINLKRLNINLAKLIL